MKTGILTYHRSHNYGAVLQAVALRKVLEKLGHDARYLDYWPRYQRNMYKIIPRRVFNSLSGIRKVKYLISTGMRLPDILKRRRRFNKFIGEHISPFIIPVGERTDCIIFGSDQIWRKQPGLNYKLNPVYFGEGVNNTNMRVSYAASMGIINLTDEDKRNIWNWLHRFDSISVRESDLKDSLSEIGLTGIEVTLDPTLLISKEEWTKIIPMQNEEEKDRYLVVYDLQMKAFDMNAVREFAKRKNLSIKILKGSVDEVFPNEENMQTAGPAEMVRCIAKADYIFTSSFHGLVFSIIFRRPFYVSYIENGGRAESLLSMVNLDDRMIQAGEKYIPELGAIDYNKVDEILDLHREKSLDFLKGHS